MLNKKLIIVAAVAIIVILTVISIVNYYVDRSTKNTLMKKTENFIEVWGNYNYQSFSSYPEKTKEYLSEQAYQDYFGNTNAILIRSGRLNTQQFSLTTKAEKSRFVKKNGSVYVFNIMVVEESTAYNEPERLTRQVDVYWEKEQDDWKVIKVEYK